MAIGLFFEKITLAVNNQEQKKRSAISRLIRPTPQGRRARWLAGRLPVTEDPVLVRFAERLQQGFLEVDVDALHHVAIVAVSEGDPDADSLVGDLVGTHQTDRMVDRRNGSDFGVLLDQRVTQGVVESFDGRASLADTAFGVAVDVDLQNGLGLRLALDAVDDGVDDPRLKDLEEVRQDARLSPEEQAQRSHGVMEVGTGLFCQGHVYGHSLVHFRRNVDSALL